MLEKIFKKMCEIRYFEENLIEFYKAGKIHVPVYLSYGQEAVAATISELCPNFMLFPQHRGHSWYLAYGGSPEKLRDEVLGLPTGCSYGRGGSSDIQCDSMEAHHGFIGENVSVATGYALGSKKNTMAVFGDGAAEEDYVLASLGFAARNGLQIMFMCEDNDLAILTEIPVRRYWDTVEVAKSFGLNGISILNDDPETIMKEMEGLVLPAYVNIKTCRHKWHVGIGTDYKEQPRDRLALLRKKVRNASKIESEARQRMEEIWKS